MPGSDLQPDVLLVEDNPGDARLVKHHLNATHVADIVGDVTLHHEETLSDGLNALEANSHDILFLDLGLPESTGRQTLDRVLEEDLRIPLVVLTGLNDRKTAVTAIQRGAQDYLLKDDLDADTLARSLRYAIERNQQEEKLRRQNERLDEFASVVSHDLRNPLNVAEGRLDIAREQSRNEHLDIAASALNRMEQLIEDLLTLARLGEAIDELEFISLKTLGEECWKNIDTANADLVIDTDQVIHADEGRLRQLIENLIRNAIEHGGQAVTVTIGALSDGFYVEDDGPGIPDGESDQIFEKGYSTSPEGTGFGLMIVEVIADAHDWHISVNESVTGGARFEITGVDIE
ncbi:sensor histidine kinase [Halopenitus sp. H-Gu1]|uniref:sensor histidine kinase n=1 Tax=Halopenitus sp. H-Gu1 TaxID=3242697 RepID=UPI00359F008C